MKKLFFCMIASVLCLSSVGAAETKSCPEGCFCLKNGMYSDNLNVGDAEMIRYCKSPASKRWSTGNNSGAMYCRATVADNHQATAASGAKYFLDDFSEFYYGVLGFYGFMKGNFVYENECPKTGGSYRGSAYDNIFQCPETHPHSAAKSKALTDCFKYDDKGNKVYYGQNSYNFVSGSCDISGVKALVDNLQSALNNANKAAQDLQNALNKVQSQSVSNGKALIDAGISEKVQNISDNKKSGTNFQTGKKLRSGSKSFNNDVEAAKAIISAGI